MLEATKATPIVPWIGGKRRLAKHILPLFPEHTCYVEPFCGAAALYFLAAPSSAIRFQSMKQSLDVLYLAKGVAVIAARFTNIQNTLVRLK